MPPITLIKKYNERIPDFSCDDEEDLCEILKFNLETERLRSRHRQFRRRSLEIGYQCPPQFALLDVMMGRNLRIQNGKYAEKRQKRQPKFLSYSLPLKTQKMIR